jgi:hypothetical protein
MQVGQLRHVIEAFVNFGALLCRNGDCTDLRALASVLPPSSRQTVTQFLAHLKKSLPKGARFQSPEALRPQLEAIEAALSAAGTKASADIKNLLALLEGNQSVGAEQFTRTLAAARDFVPPSKTKPPKPETRVDAIVAGYVDRFRKAAGKSREFETVFAALRADSKLSDARVKKISKALWAKSAKSRPEAFDHILAFQNQEALSFSSSKALDLTAV